ncbi:MAG: transcription termination factor Rho [Prevotella sp.]|nr:transcription termination factor Rho [Prevotella sp.]
MEKEEILTTEPVVEAPKRKRGRPSKAELEARRQLELQFASTSEETPAESENTPASVPQEGEVTSLPQEDEGTSVSPSGDDVVAPKRRRRTKAEIIAAAALAAEALAKKNDEAPSAMMAEEPVVSEAGYDTPMEGHSIIPEEAFASAGGGQDDDQPGLLERLQSKMNGNGGSEDKPWAGDPADGSDFIIIEDLPVEDNSVIPYTDMFDTPQQNISRNSMLQEDPIGAASAIGAYDFKDIIESSGVLEIMPDGYGFLRSSDYNYLSSPDDVYLTVQQIRQYSLKTGDVVECKVRPPYGTEKYFTLSSITKVNGRNPREIRDRISFENLTPLFPEEKFTLCGDRSTTNISTRIVDLFSPIGKGQRSLIVAQPKTGKTILMKDIANAIAANHPEAYIMMLLIDERPEEVTDMARTVNAEVIASTFDEPADRHVKIAGLVLEKAKRLVECGHDVVIFLDSITRLARAYNTVAPASGKVLTGGVDANALQKPKRFFGAARNIENGGSLTIIATALTDTGSKMDEVIFEEFKGTGNSELQLDRTLSNRRIFPAVNLVLSSTRRDDLLQDETTINRMWILRKHIADMTASEAMNEIHNLMERTHDNNEFLMAMNG